MNMDPVGCRGGDGKTCGGASVCKHQRQRNDCKDCGGSRVCEHDRCRSPTHGLREWESISRLAARCQRGPQSRGGIDSHAMAPGTGVSACCLARSQGLGVTKGAAACDALAHG